MVGCLKKVIIGFAVFFFGGILLTAVLSDFKPGSAGRKIESPTPPAEPIVAKPAPVAPPKPAPKPEAPVLSDRGFTREQEERIRQAKEQARKETEFMDRMAVPIPGLKLATVERALRREQLRPGKGFDRGGRSKEVRYERGGKNASNISVLVMVLDETDVDGVDVTVTTTSDVYGRDVAEAMAGLAYEGGDPQQAKRWVRENWGTKAETKIGRCAFLLSSGPAMKLLRMSSTRKP